jgi:hypothetical protein
MDYVPSSVLPDGSPLLACDDVWALAAERARAAWWWWVAAVVV